MGYVITNPGLGQVRNYGLGLFDSGGDWTSWGVGEWLTIAGGVYFVMSIFGDVGRGVGKVRGRRSSKRGGRGSKYGPYYSKLSASDQAKARAAFDE
jgi:hypothetical protein